MRAVLCKNWGPPESLVVEDIASPRPGNGQICVSVGGNHADPAMRGMAWKGRYLVVGFAAGEIPRIPLNLALLKGFSIVGVFWGEFARRERDLNAANLKELTEWLRAGTIKPLVSATYPLDRAADALKDLVNRKVRGKAVLVTD